MKKLIFILVVLVGVISMAPSDSMTFVNEANACCACDDCCESDNVENTVYICTGQYAKAYHKSRNCRGLGNCRGDIKQVSIEEAKRMERTPCGYCYK